MKKPNKVHRDVSINGRISVHSQITGYLWWRRRRYWYSFELSPRGRKLLQTVIFRNIEDYSIVVPRAITNEFPADELVKYSSVKRGLFTFRVEPGEIHPNSSRKPFELMFEKFRHHMGPRATRTIRFTPAQIEVWRSKSQF